jgi:hypothetical protein
VTERKGEKRSSANLGVGGDGLLIFKPPPSSKNKYAIGCDDDDYRKYAQQQLGSTYFNDTHKY